MYFRLTQKQSLKKHLQYEILSQPKPWVSALVA